MDTPLDEALTLLGSLPDIPRARVLSALLDGNNLRHLVAIRREAIYRATRADGATYATVAAELGVSVAAVNKAVTAHRRSARGYGLEEE